MRTLPHTFALTAAIAALAAGSLALTGCTAASQADEGGHLRVVTTTTQLTDFARVVGGDDVTLNGLMQPGASAHHFDPSPAQLLELKQADVLIMSGQGLDSFVDSAIEASGFSGKIVDASSGIDLAAAREATKLAEQEPGYVEEDEEHEHEEEGEHGAAGEEADHDEHDHGHSDVNPHIWTDPMMAAGMVEAVADGLADADAEHAAGFRERAGEYEAHLTELDDWAATEFARVPDSERILVTGHDSLRYFLNAYDITFAGSILPSFEDNAEPSVAEIDALVAKIKEQGVRAIFVESTMNPELARTIASESGAQVIDGDTIAVDALGAEGSDTDTYLAATVNNTRIILEAWGYTPDDLPEALQKSLR